MYMCVCVCVCFKQHAVVCVLGNVTNKTGSSETYFQPVYIVNTKKWCGIFFNKIFYSKFLQCVGLN